MLLRPYNANSTIKLLKKQLFQAANNPGEDPSDPDDSDASSDDDSKTGTNNKQNDPDKEEDDQVPELPLMLPKTMNKGYLQKRCTSFYVNKPNRYFLNLLLMLPLRLDAIMRYCLLSLHLIPL